MEYESSRHARDMLIEWAISKEWLSRTENAHDRTELGEDYNRDYIKAIPEFGWRYLRVVVNPQKYPVRIVTFFFDRRIRTL